MLRHNMLMYSEKVNEIKLPKHVDMIMQLLINHKYLAYIQLTCCQKKCN